MDHAIKRDFSAAIRGRTSEVDLVGAATAIAALGDPGVTRAGVSATLDAIADGISVDDLAGDTHALASALDHELFTIWGFHGDPDVLGSPEASYINRVLDNRTGLPILMALVYLEVGRRIGLEGAGVGYPGHFLVRLGPADDPTYVDPFHQGSRLDRAELLARLNSDDLRGVSPEALLCGITGRQLLQRMLNNLRTAYRRTGDIERWQSAVDLQVELEPWNAHLVGERGLVRYRRGDHELALEDLEAYVDAQEPETVSAGARRLLNELRLRYRGEEEAP